MDFFIPFPFPNLLFYRRESKHQQGNQQVTDLDHLDDDLVDVSNGGPSVRILDASSSKKNVTGVTIFAVIPLMLYYDAAWKSQD